MKPGMHQLDNAFLQGILRMCGTTMLVVLITACTSRAQAPLPWKIGTHQEVITPVDSAYIAGHTHNRRFSGVNDDLYVKAVAVASASDTLVLLTFDCIGLLYPQLRQIRDSIARLMPSFPVHQIAMTSTHTHSGPDVVGLWGKDIFHSGVDDNYMQYLVGQAVKSIVVSIKNMVPATAQYAMGHHGAEWVYNISQPTELDRSLTVLQFTGQQGNKLATLVNFACHPTFLDAVNDRVSSDYIGGYYLEMDRVQGGTNMFLQGAIGGWVQPEYEDKTHQQAFFRGRELAQEVLALLEKSVPLRGHEITYNRRIFNMPVENPGFIQLSKLGVIDRVIGDSVTTEVAYFTIGNAAFASHPGESVPALSHSTKALMQNTGPKFILGLGMDALGYILKPEFFEEDREIPHSTYLCSVSVGPETQAYVYNILKEMIKKGRKE